ncbi:MAG: hypothetical protein A4E27_01582 [Methanobacterium sp. PtaU1.Bin242]|nr:MAG: hypothetical protein A4E27_01582 [Methanobacterium sp. PtaU1.Bin242]
MANHSLNGGNSLEPLKEYSIMRKVYPITNIAGIMRMLAAVNIPSKRSLFGLEKG